MTNEIVNKFIQFSENEQIKHPEWRKGQTIVNCSYVYCYHLVRNLINTKVDCFYEDSKIDTFIKAFKENLKLTEPFVGIFWFYNGLVMFSHAVPLTEGLIYGDAITGVKDHADYWEELSKGQLSFLPESLRQEYFSIPRGRVVYHKDTDKFHILHGSNIKKNDLQQVRKLFCIPKEKSVFEIDTHYCEYTSEEWNLFCPK